MAAEKGFAPGEVLLLLGIVEPLFDPGSPVTQSYEILRDGEAIVMERVEAVTFRNAQGDLFKAYNHTDSRGTMLRVEARPAKVKVSFQEAMAFFEGKQPLGRDAKIADLALQVEENTKAILTLRKELKLARERLERGPPPGFAPE